MIYYTFISKRGMVLFTVLCLMVIFLIITLAIVSLSTGNLTIMGNIYGRLQALELANSACMYAIYELESNYDTSITWTSGNIPSPPSGLDFTDHNYSPITDTNGLPGKLKVAYINNLNNPNNITITGGPSFYPSLTATEIYGETAVIIAQGEYNGFKRTVKVVVKNTSSANGADDTITIKNGTLMLNGIDTIENLSPTAGSIYAGNKIEYDNLTSARILNGSILASKGAISKINGIDIQQRVTLPNCNDVNLPDWDLANPNISFGPPDTSGFYTKETGYPTESSGLPASSIVRPSFFGLTPDITDDKTYVISTALDLNNQNIFINGSVHISYDAGTACNMVNSNLFINGVFTSEGDILGDNSNIFVTGYDPNGNSISFFQDRPFNDYPDAERGVALFSEGNVNCKNDKDKIDGEFTANMDKWIKATPEDITNITDMFNIFNIQSLNPDDAFDWYVNGGHNIVNANVNNDSGEHLFQGCPGCDEELLNAGLKISPEEMRQWFNMAEATEGMSWATERNGSWRYANWKDFVKNPSIFNAGNAGFFQGMIFTHGTFTTEGTNGPICITGAVLAKKSAAFSPPGHGGNITLTNDSYILYCNEYVKSRSSQMVIKPVISIYSWQEL